MSDKSHMHGGGESYSGIVPAKQSNEGQGGPEEIVEGRPLTKENTEEPNPYRTPSRESGPSGLDRVREAAKGDRKLRFTALLHHVNIDLLRSSYHSLKKQAAAGVDGVTWARIWRRPGGTISRPARANPSWGLSSETVTESLDPESRWKATTIGDRGAGRQNRPARGGDRFSTRSGKRTFWAFRTDSGRGAASMMHWTRCTSGSRARK